MCLRPWELLQICQDMSQKVLLHRQHNKGSSGSVAASLLLLASLFVSPYYYTASKKIYQICSNKKDVAPCKIICWWYWDVPPNKHLVMTAVTMCLVCQQIHWGSCVGEPVAAIVRGSLTNLSAGSCSKHQYLSVIHLFPSKWNYQNYSRMRWGLRVEQWDKSGKSVFNCVNSESCPWVWVQRCGLWFGWKTVASRTASGKKVQGLDFSHLVKDKWETLTASVQLKGRRRRGQFWQPWSQGSDQLTSWSWH